MLAVDWPDLNSGFPSQRDNELTGADNCLFIGERDRLSGLDRTGGRQYRRVPRCRGHDDVDVRMERRIDQAIDTNGNRHLKRVRWFEAFECDQLRSKTRCLLGEEMGVGPGGQADDAESVRELRDDVERLPAD